jgi:HEAT repeat protein
LRAHVALEVAARLMRSNDPDERVRGIERAASSHTPESLALLLRAAANGDSAGLDPRVPVEGMARKDPRALLEVVRALAEWSDEEEARSALASVVAAPSLSFATRPAGRITDDPVDDDAVGADRIRLAREEAAFALAAGGRPLALEALVTIARAGGPGQVPALHALSAHPPSTPAVLAGAGLTTPATVMLAAQVGDLRSLDAILVLARSSDAELRAAAIAASGASGDTRVADVARAAANDPDPRVRAAAVSALVRIRADVAARAVEALIRDDATALPGLRLAREVLDDGVTKAISARAAVSADAEVRRAAVEALGRQTTPIAVAALTTLAAGSELAGDVACALGRSPSTAAMGAIEAMAGSAAVTRLAARAYFVRRYERGERSLRLDALVESLARSADPSNRAVGVEILVALGQASIEGALADGDAAVRRAGVLGSIARWTPGTGELLLSRLAVEPDASTRIVLATGLIDGDPHEIVPTSRLVQRLRAGGPDAPLSALALAARSSEAGAVVDQTILSRDPVMRAQTLRGLGASRGDDVVGRIVAAYAWEGDADVRRAAIEALTRHPAEAAMAGRSTLMHASSMDPDEGARWTAARALDGMPPERTMNGDGTPRAIAWLRLAPTAGSSGLPGETALVIRSDGVAVPVAFDDDGYALVPGMPPGEATLRLAPRLPPYSSQAP